MPVAQHTQDEIDAVRDAIIAEVASGLGLSEAMLRKWMPEEAFLVMPEPAVTADPAEVTLLRYEKRVLELQVDILKQALAHATR